MERLAKYRATIRQILKQYDRLLRQAEVPGVESHLLLDEERDEYALVKSGWADHKRIRGTVVHMRITDGKIWVEEDWTEDGVATDLLKAGVPPQDIVLAFQPPELRQLGEFAVA